jgi:hypothetical protein
VGAGQRLGGCHGHLAVHARALVNLDLLARSVVCARGTKQASGTKITRWPPAADQPWISIVSSAGE